MDSMKVALFCFLSAAMLPWIMAQDYYDLENNDEINEKMKDVLTTSGFTCVGRDKGYYADVGLGCEVYHQCLPLQNDDGTVYNVAKFSFTCNKPSLFDQKACKCLSPDDPSLSDCPGEESSISPCTS